MMGAIAEGRRFGLLALAKPNFFGLIELYLDAFKGGSFDLFMITVAEW
jgi:hypothetical protein